MSERIYLLTPEEINKEIAIHLGYALGLYNGFYSLYGPNHHVVALQKFETQEEAWSFVPDFCRSLDACAPLIVEIAKIASQLKIIFKGHSGQQLYSGLAEIYEDEHGSIAEFLSNDLFDVSPIHAAAHALCIDYLNLK